MGDRSLRELCQPLGLLRTTLAEPSRAVAQGSNSLPLAQDVGNMHQLLALKSFSAVSTALSKGWLCRLWATG